ncbi:MAG: hypothetical protein EOO41_03430, partial [Methanobacteriota archaeon]
MIERGWCDVSDATPAGLACAATAGSAEEGPHGGPAFQATSPSAPLSFARAPSPLHSHGVLPPSLQSVHRDAASVLCTQGVEGWPPPPHTPPSITHQRMPAAAADARAAAT